MSGLDQSKCRDIERWGEWEMVRNGHISATESSVWSTEIPLHPPKLSLRSSLQHVNTSFTPPVVTPLQFSSRNSVSKGQFCAMCSNALSEKNLSTFIIFNVLKLSKSCTLASVADAPDSETVWSNGQLSVIALIPFGVMLYVPSRFSSSSRGLPTANASTKLFDKGVPLDSKVRSSANNSSFESSPLNPNAILESQLSYVRTVSWQNG